MPPIKRKAEVIIDEEASDGEEMLRELNGGKKKEPDSGGLKKGIAPLRMDLVLQVNDEEKQENLSEGNNFEDELDEIIKQTLSARHLMSNVDINQGLLFHSEMTPNYKTSRLHNFRRAGTNQNQKTSVKNHN